MTLIQKTLLFSLIFLISCKSVPHSSRAKVYKKRSRTHKRPNKHVNKSQDYVLRKGIIDEAKKYRGIPYKYGGKAPHSGFDCSGFSTFVFGLKGIDIKGSSSQLARLGKSKSRNKIEAGDLAFFGNKGKVSHVAIVVSAGANEFKVIHSTSSKGVIISDIDHSTYWKSRFLFAKDVISNYHYGLSGLDK